DSASTAHRLTNLRQGRDGRAKNDDAPAPSRPLRILCGTFLRAFGARFSLPRCLIVNPFTSGASRMPEGGKRTSLTASYSWGQSGLEAQFASVFQPAQGIFSPGYPLAPPEPA